MFKIAFVALLSFFLPFSNGTVGLVTGTNQSGSAANTGTLEKMIVESGGVAINFDLNKLNGKRTNSAKSNDGLLRFEAEQNSFFKAMVFNGELRGTLPGSMNIIPQDFVSLPAELEDSYDQLILEHMPFGEHYELAIRDSKTGFVFFNIEGHLYEYSQSNRELTLREGRVLVSEEFAARMSRPSLARVVVGQVAMNAILRPIEITQIVDGEVTEDVLPPMKNPDSAGTRPGPDVVVGDVIGLAQFGSSDGTHVGISVGTDSCNFGTENLNWFALPSNDHPVIPQNLYRMSGGTGNDERFEQIGQSSVKHAFTALTQNLCALGCNGVGGSRLGSGCSDPYSAGLNAGPNLGSRAWINPFTGAYPRGDSATPPNSHSGHSHTGPIHRMRTEINDLNTSMNPGATYYAEAQYITPHEYTWCETNPTQCNMYNNVSYRQYNVTGTSSFSFSTGGSTTQREKTALNAWPGATMVEIRPEPGVDGIGTVAYKVTNPSPGVWHYEYAVHNINLERAIRMFSVPLGTGITVSNVGFHAPPQQLASPADGTTGDAGFKETPWAQTNTGTSMTWNTDTFVTDPNANAIRWGTMYNFRFDSNRPPQNTTATVGFYKTGSPITAQVQAPMPLAASAVTVSGRVFSVAGQGVFNAKVFMTDAGNNTLYATTNSFGYYSFSGIPTGQTYTVGVNSKQYSFTNQSVPVNNTLSGLNFTANTP